MATFTGADFALDMRGIDVTEEINEGDGLFLSDTTFSAAGDDGFTNTYTGTGFVDNNADHIPDSGIIGSLSVTFGDDPVVLISDFSLSWEDYWSFVALSSTAAYLDALFGGDDTFTGSSGNDYLFALGGNDTMSGLGGKDALDGGKGKDGISGGNGKDKLVGGAQQDTLTGDSGADMFVFGKAKDTGVGETKHDIVTDFNVEAGDVIDLRKMNQDDNFHLGGDSFDGEAGEIIQFAGDPGELFIQGDLNGDAIADFEILLLGTEPIPVDSFAL
jgi:Ca2+-binding RTX toxin-like protein